MHFFLLLLVTMSVALADDATVVKVQGSVKVSGRPVKVGDLVREGEEINAQGPKTLVQLRLSDGSRLLVKDAVLKVEKTEGRKVSLLRLLRGVIFTEKAKSTNGLEVVTRNATLGVRGTKFFVQESEEETYLCVCEGLVAISNSVSSAEVGVREDATVKAKEVFTKSKANDMMWKMALDGFKEMQ